VCIITDFTVEYKYISEADADISIKGGGGVFCRKKNWISKQFALRKIKRYEGIIQSENYKTFQREKNDKDQIGNIQLSNIFTSLKLS
jgi:hypothetical protein